MANIHFNAPFYTTISAEDEASKRVASVVIGTTNTVGGIADRKYRAENVDYLCTGEHDELIINEAISSLSERGGKVLILDGIYDIGASILLKNNVTLEGSSRMGTVLDASNYSMSIFIDLYTNADGIQDVSISNFTFKGLFNSSSLANRIIIQAGINANINNCTFYNVGIAYIGLSSYTKTDFLSNFHYVSDCDFYGDAYSLRQETSYGIINNCNFYDNESNSYIINISASGTVNEPKFGNLNIITNNILQDFKQRAFSISNTLARTNVVSNNILKTSKEFGGTQNKYASLIFGKNNIFNNNKINTSQYPAIGISGENLISSNEFGGINNNGDEKSIEPFMTFYPSYETDNTLFVGNSIYGFFDIIQGLSNVIYFGLVHNDVYSEAFSGLTFYTNGGTIEEVSNVKIDVVETN